MVEERDCASERPWLESLSDCKAKPGRVLCWWSCSSVPLRLSWVWARVSLFPDKIGLLVLDSTGTWVVVGVVVVVVVVVVDDDVVPKMQNITGYLLYN